MLSNPTLDQLKRLGLTGMAAAFEDIGQDRQASELSHAEWLALLLDREASLRATKRLSNRLRAARLRFPEACVEDLDFKTPRGLDRTAVMAPAKGGWLEQRENLILTGPTGLERPGSLVHWLIRPPGSTSLCSTAGSPDCSRTSLWPARTAATRD